MFVFVPFWTISGPRPPTCSTWSVLVQFWTISGPKPPRCSKWSVLVSFWMISGPGPKCLKQMILETNLIWKTEVSPIWRNLGVALFHAIQRLAFCTEGSKDNLGAIRKEVSIRNSFPFGMAYHSEWLRNSPERAPWSLGVLGVSTGINV